MLLSICNNIDCANNNHLVIFRYKWSNYSLCIVSLSLSLSLSNKQTSTYGNKCYVKNTTIAHLNVVWEGEALILPLHLLSRVCDAILHVDIMRTLLSLHATTQVYYYYLQ